MLPLTIWMNMPSFYQGDLFRSLTNCGGVDLRVVMARRISTDRVRLGWSDDLSGYRYHILESRHRVLDAISVAMQERDRTHIVNGMWGEPIFSLVLAAMITTGMNYVLYSEAPSPMVSRSLGKKLLRSVFGRVAARKAQGILAISHFAEKFYEDLGVPKSRIYPFGYFRASPAQGNELLVPGSKMEVIFVGQLVHRKGVDLLLEAMLPLFEKYPEVSLTYIGRGDMQTNLHERVASIGLEHRVNLAPAMTPQDIPDRVRLANVLVLPSRWDGWGLVVNEAMAVGVPVIVSDHCGAADLVRDGVNGYVFRSEDVTSLRQSICDFLERRGDWPRMRAAAAETGKKIDTDTAVTYLVACCKHLQGMDAARPVAPWTP